MITKNYVVVDIASGCLVLAASQTVGTPEELVPPVPLAGQEMQEISEGQLAGGSFSSFVTTKKPVISSGSITGWTDRHSSMVFDQSAPVKLDGSNSPAIAISEALPGSNFRVSISRGMSCSLSSGVFDGSGMTNMTVQNVVALGGQLQVSPDGHCDFVEFVYAIEFEP